jgi:hypothetical protein
MESWRKDLKMMRDYYSICKTTMENMNTISEEAHQNIGRIRNEMGSISGWIGRLLAKAIEEEKKKNKPKWWKRFW